MFNDGLADTAFVRNSDIQVSSNEEDKNAIRPAGKGWTPAPGDTKRSITIFVGDALVYGASIRLVRAKYVEKFDILLLDNGKVSCTFFYKLLHILFHSILISKSVKSF